MLTLSDHIPFADGGNRLCFIYPNKPDRCVKVTKPGRNGKAVRTARGWRGWFHSAEYYDDSMREFREYQYLLKHNGDSLWRHIPRHFGFVDTDLGRGAVIQMIRNIDDSPALTLREELLVGTKAESAIAEFRAFLATVNLPYWDGLLSNILCARTAPEQWRLYIVDGLGRSPLLPLARYSRYLRIANMKRRMIKLEHSIAAYAVGAR